MRADPVDQRRLLELQVQDTAAAQLERRVASLPINQRVADLTAQLTQANDALVASRTALSDAEGARQRAEDDVVPVRQRLQRDQERADQGTIDARALTSLLDEIDHLKVRIENLEDLELEAMETVERTAAEAESATAAAAAAEAELAQARAEREAALVQARAEMAELRSARQAVAALEPADLLELYERLRARYSGVGAAELLGRRCTGCGLEATTADYDAYRSAAADEVVRCAECQRILVRNSD
ncbi:MAG: C4-type zinc ribbon domain-containing protein [Propionibacteriaceae bacterium]|jgi:predicted  nucleic acid-binding Zn-ribbon protein|nr:C4-type zinc ribbon domain-containing protein [Propionibacteriaceae bacterium]